MLNQEGCPGNMLAIKDAMDVLEGRWKLPILIALSSGSKRFRQISKSIEGISDKMLARELKDLELNLLIRRDALDEASLIAEYTITEHGRSLEQVLRALYAWGQEHRRQVIGK